jgi:hypothetical protein
MYPTPSVVISRVTQISIGAEGFFDAKTIDSFFLSTSRVPILLLPCYTFALPHRHDNLLIVNPVPIKTKEMEQQLSDALLVVFAKASYCVEIIGKTRQGWFPGLAVYFPIRKFMEGR